MSVFPADCPHCGTKKVAFTLIHQHHAGKEEDNIWDTLSICGQCSRCVLVAFLMPRNTNPKGFLGSTRYNETHVLGMYPSLPDATAPAYTSDNVAQFYRQGMDNLPGNWDAAGTMFRKALDTCLKSKFPRITGTLKQRIDKAAEAYELTPALAEWAHQIRLDGNDAAHEEKPFSKEDAERLQTFTELVLRYLFTLPGMLQQAQNVPAGNEE